MRLVIQRVTKAEVRVNDEVVGKIDKGLFVLVGVKKGDLKEDAEVLAGKLVKLRVMSDEKGKMNLSIKDLPAPAYAVKQAGVGGKVLVVSQFTLYADISDGNRPSFIEAAEPKPAKKVYEHFIAKLEELGLRVQTGKFGEYMQINAELDGPVTIII